jgi:hypothetical protein
MLKIEWFFLKIITNSTQVDIKVKMMIIVVEMKILQIRDHLEIISVENR